MISRSTLIGALVVVELSIAGLAVRAVAGDGAFGASAPPFSRGSLSLGALTPPARLNSTLVAGPAPHVVIDVSDVDVIVETVAEPVVRSSESLHVTGWVSGTLPALTAARSADGVRIARSGGTHVQTLVGDVTRQLHVAVPANARVEILSAGRIEAAGLRSKLVAHSGDGSIHVRDHRGDLDVSSDSGLIELIDVEGSDIAADTHDGRLYLTRVGADHINGHSNYGRIYAVDLRAVDGALSTHFGRVAVSFTAKTDATVSASTGDGDVSVSGAPSTLDGDQARSVKFGSGRGRFEVKTDDGAVNISQGANV